MKLNEISILSVSFLFLIPILLTENEILVIFLTIMAISNLIIIKRFKYKIITYFVLMMLIPLLSVFFTTLFYTKDITNSEAINFFNFIKTNKYSLHLAIFLVIRTLSLSLISFSYMICLEYDKLIVSLIQNFKLPVTVGYSLLVTFNAFFHLKEEYFRIKNAYLMRFSKRKITFLLLFPIIVSAARYAYYAGLSLESRGLNGNKTFLEKFYWNKNDTTYFLIIAISVLLIVGYFVFSGKFLMKLI